MAKREAMFMESTEVPAERTAAEVVGLLARAGARRTTVEYDDAGAPIAIEFGLVVPGFSVPFPFSVPVRTARIYDLLQERRGHPNSRSQVVDRAKHDRDKARRIAWRQVYRWMEAQLAMVDAGMAKRQEVFMPYLLDTASGKTLFELMEGSGFKQLAAAGGFEAK